MAKDIPDGGTMLFVYFATERSKEEKKYKEDSARIQSFVQEKKVVTMKATREHFMEEVEKADVIYIRGGDTQRLKSTLDTYPDFIRAIQGKVVSGSSTGAYVLSQYYFANSLGKVMEGYGCLPVGVICHYMSKIHPMPSDVNPVHEMEKYNTHNKCILLKDFEWIIQEL